MLHYGRHWIDDDDIQAVVDVLKSWPLTQGPKIGEFEAKFSKYVGARFAVGSSNMMTLGFLNKAMLIATICLSPPLRFDTLVLMYAESLGNISSAFLLLSSKSSRFTVYPAIFKFSSTVRCVNVLSVCGRYAIPSRAISCGGRLDMTRPSIVISPW